MLREIRIHGHCYMTGMYIVIVGRMRSGRIAFLFSLTTTVYVVVMMQRIDVWGACSIVISPSGPLFIFNTSLQGIAD